MFRIGEGAYDKTPYVRDPTTVGYEYIPVWFHDPLVQQCLQTEYHPSVLALDVDETKEESKEDCRPNIEIDCIANFSVDATPLQRVTFDSSGSIGLLSIPSLFDSHCAKLYVSISLSSISTPHLIIVRFCVACVLEIGLNIFRSQLCCRLTAIRQPKRKRRSIG